MKVEGLRRESWRFWGETSYGTTIIMTLYYIISLCRSFMKNKVTLCSLELIKKLPNGYCVKDTEVVERQTIPLINVDILGKREMHLFGNRIF